MVTVTGVLRRLGPLGRKIAWNREFKTGAEFAGARSATIVELVRQYGEGRRVVELACGDGSLSRSLAGVTFADYQGFDISDEAVRLANADAPAGRRFFAETMEDWDPKAPFDLLVVEEAIYYLTPAQQLRLLEKAFAAAPEANVIVTVHSKTKHQKSLDNCKRGAAVADEIVDGERVFLILRRP